jgi:hypothetical protein
VQVQLRRLIVKLPMEDMMRSSCEISAIRQIFLMNFRAALTTFLETGLLEHFEPVLGVPRKG